MNSRRLNHRSASSGRSRRAPAASRRGLPRRDFVNPEREVEIYQTTRKLLTAVSAAAALALGSARASDQALLDALVRKGILTDQEAQEVSKEAVQPTAPAKSKIKLGDWVQALRLYGDIRLRYQYDDSQPQIPKAPLQTDYPNVS